MFSKSRSSCRPLRCARTLALWLVLQSSVARAEPAEDPVRARARALAYAAVEAYAVSDFKTASDNLDESFKLVPLPSLGLWSARALAKLGKLLEADERYRAVGALAVAPSDPPLQQSAREEAARERAELQRIIPSVSIGLRGATAGDVVVVLNGVRLEPSELGKIRRLNPGQHTLTGLHHSARSDVIFELQEGEHERVWLNIEPGLAQPIAPLPAARAAAPREALADETRDILRTSGWVALTGSGVCLLGGSLAYVMGRRKYSELERRDLCVTGGCSPADVEAYDTWRSSSAAGFIAGGVLGAVGLGLVIATQAPASGKQRPVTLSLRFEPRAAVLGGRF